MKKLVVLFLLIVLPSLLLYGQKVVYEAQKDEKISAVSGPLPVPVLTTDQKLRIRDLQHRYDELRLQMAKLELEKVHLEKQESDALSSLNGLAFDLARESKVDTNRFNLNIDTLQWEKRP